MTVAVIGAGRWGRNLVRTFHELGQLACVAEPEPSLRRELADAFPSLPLFADFSEVLATDVTAVAVATPVTTHATIVKASLLRGKDVFVEKPITLSSQHAVELNEIASREGRILMVGHLLLYDPGIEFVKAYLESGKLGEIRLIHQERLNLGTVRTAENALWSLGVHDIAVLLHLVGHYPGQIAATGQRILQPGVDDDVHLQMVFPNGVQAHLHTSWLWPEKRRRLTVVGSKAMLVWDELARTCTVHNKRAQSDLSVVDEGSSIVFRATGDPLRLELQHFLACIKNRVPPRSDAKSAVDVVRILEQASLQLGATK
jgi:predicted dehydrogenase